MCLLAATGAIAYAGDHAMTDRARAAWSAPAADWLDRAGYGEADFLALPGGSPHFAWSLEAWNRDFGRPLWLAGKRPPTDPCGRGDATVGEDGTLLVDGAPAEAGLLVVNDFGTQIDLEGTVVARPSPGSSSCEFRPRLTSGGSQRGSSATAGRRGTSPTGSGPSASAPQASTRSGSPSRAATLREP